MYLKKEEQIIGKNIYKCKKRKRETGKRRKRREYSDEVDEKIPENMREEKKKEKKEKWTGS